MIVPKRTKFLLLSLLILLNIILRLQVVPREIGNDSFLVHMMANSISEFGYAKWILHPLSFFGMYPYSEVSAVPFQISGIFQSIGTDMNGVIFLYCIILGILSIFTAYIMANAIINDDIFKILVAFAFSTSPAILAYSTWTLPARGLFIILTPLLVYIILKINFSSKYIALAAFFSVFMYTVHHLIYFCIPIFLSFISLWLLFKGYTTKFPQKSLVKNSSLKISPLIPIIGFFLMFSIPFFMGKFIEQSRYYPIYEDYIRYTGMLIIPAVGGLCYLILKPYKNFGQSFILLNSIFVTALIYEQTYMKWFLPIFIVPFVGIGLLNISKLRNKKYSRVSIFVFLILSTIFSGYYQFLNEYNEVNNLKRNMDDSTYTTGRWMKEYVNRSVISNDFVLGKRIAAASEVVHNLIGYTLLDYTYGFVPVNMSDFTWYPITSEEFWFNVGETKIDQGEYSWDRLNLLYLEPKDFNIAYYAENTFANGYVLWHHKQYPSNLLNKAYNEGNLVYDGGMIRLWELK